MCHGGHSLDRRVRVTACLSEHGWWLFGCFGGSGGRLLQRMVPSSGHVLHALSSVMAFLDAGSVLAFVFRLFCFYFFCSQSAFMMLKYYRTVYWHRC
jgi:hypothetical protein